MPIGMKEAKVDQDNNIIFQSYSRGVATCRDSWAYSFGNINFLKISIKQLNFTILKLSSGVRVLKREKLMISSPMTKQR